MQAVKRIEIITESLEMREVCRLLDELGVSGYTILRDVRGRGERGIQSGDELSDVFSNSLLLLACAPEQADKVVETIRPILKRRGGVCLVSDALWVLH